MIIGYYDQIFFGGGTYYKLSKKEYINNTLDDVCWKFYIGNDLGTNYMINGYSIYPKEIEKIYNIFNQVKEKYIGNV